MTTPAQTIPPAYRGIVDSMLRSRLEHPELYAAANKAQAKQTALPKKQHKTAVKVTVTR